MIKRDIKKIRKRCERETIINKKNDNNDGISRGWLYIYILHYSLLIYIDWMG